MSFYACIILRVLFIFVLSLLVLVLMHYSHMMSNNKDLHTYLLACLMPIFVNCQQYNAVISLIGVAYNCSN